MYVCAVPAEALGGYVPVHAFQYQSCKDHNRNRLGPVFQFGLGAT